MITLRYALFAEAGNISVNGMVSLMGIFFKIIAEKVPAVHPSMCVSICLEATSDGSAKAHSCVVKIIDSNDELLFRAEARQLQFSKSQNEILTHSAVFNIRNLPIKSFGDLTLSVIVDGKELGAAKIMVVPAPTAAINRGSKNEE